MARVADVAAGIDPAQHAAHVRAYLGPELGAIPLAELAPADVQAMFTGIIAEHAAIVAVAL